MLLLAAREAVRLKRQVATPYAYFYTRQCYSSATVVLPYIIDEALLLYADVRASVVLLFFLW